MSETVLRAHCSACGWSKAISEPEGGQSLFGSIAYHMARHEHRTGHGNGTSIDWERTELAGDQPEQPDTPAPMEAIFG